MKPNIRPQMKPLLLRVSAFSLLFLAGVAILGILVSGVQR
jgi:hypothetical protein